MKKYKNYYLPEDDEHYLDYFKKFDHYQEAQRNRALAQISNWRVALDIGANIGLWARELSNFFDHTICFEPNSKCIKYLEKNVNINRSKIYNVGVGSENKQMNLFTPINSGGSSFINETVIGFNKDGSKIYGEFSKSVFKQPTQIVTIDSYNFNNVDFIKIDVQGFELEVLQGAFKTLIENNPVICIEEILTNLEDSDPIKFLLDLKYEVVDRVNKEIILKKN
ncbi:FkbM family methyltransferase [Alphaproteobacteria bacterium]|nr:FkbM family methyltransferase [Alphaproteobacteria bacterium]